MDDRSLGHMLLQNREESGSSSVWHWNRTKMKLKRMRGCVAKEVSSYLDKFTWRERFGKTPREAMNGIMHDIAQQYSVPVALLSFFCLL